MMKPEQFVLWLNGVSESIGKDRLPAPEQWELIRTRLGEVITKLVAQRMLDMEPILYTPVPSVPSQYTPPSTHPSFTPPFTTSTPSFTMPTTVFRTSNASSGYIPPFECRDDDNSVQS